MKKRLFAVMVIGMAVTFAACGNSEKDNQKKAEVTTEDITFDLGDSGLEEEESRAEYKEFEGKTLGELSGLGYKINGYTGFNGEYTFDITGDEDDYQVVLDETAVEIMKNKEFGISNDELTGMLKDCVVKECYESSQPSVIGLGPIDDDAVEFPDLVGKKVSELVSEGYEFNGHVGSGNKYVFYIGGNGGNYILVLDETASELMKNWDMMSDVSKEELLKDCVVEECYIDEN